MIRHLAGSLLLAALLTGLGYSLYAFAHQDVVKARSEHAKLRAEAINLRQRLQRTQQDEPAVRLAIKQFSALSEQGVIGPEHRLDWADSLRRIQQDLRLPKAEFALQPQKRIASLPNAAPYALYASSMQWRANLLHEGDLLRFLEAVQEIDSAVILPSRCTLTDRSSQAEERNGIDADCQLDWLSIAPAAATKAQP